MSPVHDAAQAGYANAAQSYERGRPEYPEALLPWLEECLGARPGSRVVELGAGTGKFTRLLQRSGATITAIEPVEAMRSTLAALLPGIEALGGTAEASGLPTACADALVCAQSFHWFAQATALEELHRLLKPGGRLGLIWNVRDTRIPWMAEVSALLTRYEGDTPRHHSGAWRQALAQSDFGVLHETVLPWSHEGSIQDVVVERFASVSFIAALPADERRHFLQELQRLVAVHPDLKGRERVSAPYQTQAYWCVRG